MRVVQLRRLTCLIAVAVAAGACSQAETNAQTARPGRSGAPAAQGSAESATLVLEFDAPPEFTDSGTVTGFRVGFFRGNESTVLRSVDVARNAMTVRDRTVRVTVAREHVPPCGGDCVVRVQTLSPTRASAWSDPVPLDGVAARRSLAASQQRPPRPAQPRVAVINPTGAAPGQRRRGLTPADIENYAVLSAALRKVLPTDTTLEMELGRFRRLQDVAVAVVISRDHEIPFTTVSQTMAGPPRLAPRNAFAKLRPELSDPTVFRKLRVEALRLIEAPAGTAPKR